MSVIKPCPIPKEDFEKLARASSLTALPEECIYDYVNKYGPVPDWCYADEAAAVCKMSVPLFKKRVRQYLMPEVFGDLPEGFFDHPGNNMYPHHSNSEYRNQKRYIAMRKKIEAMEMKQKIFEASDLPELK